MPNVVNVKVKYLREQGYWDLLEWLKKPDHLYIGRTRPLLKGAEKSFWGNPFTIKRYGREKCLEKYREYVLSNPEMMSRIKELKGKTLGCWCHPERCHGDILIEILEDVLEKEKKEEKQVPTKLKSAKEIILT